MQLKNLKKAFAIALAGAVMTTASPVTTPIVHAVSVKAADTQSDDINLNDGSYTFVYAGLSWDEYWKSEGIYGAGDVSSSDVKDDKGELDKGGFDAVTRATTNHGLHRGNYQCDVTIFDTDGNTYEMDHWEGDKIIVLKDGTSVEFSKGTIKKADGTTATMKHYEVNGTKYVPIAVKTSDLDALKANHYVVENGGTLAGGFGEQQLQSYTETANVTANTNGLKVATKNADGTFSFSARRAGTESGLKDQDLKKAEKIVVTTKEAKDAQSYGCFLRVDLTGEDYGALGAAMQSAKWTYYGEDDTYTTPLESYGTKFAADNWMHKSNGIQLGLTESARCKLPEGYDGRGYWEITVSALGYEDYTVKVEVTADNIVYPDSDEEINTTKLEAAVKDAEALSKDDYCQDKAWDSMQVELQEAKDELAAPHAQAIVDECIAHLQAAVKDLNKHDFKEVSRVNATTTKVGLVTYKCSKCNFEKKTELAKLPLSASNITLNGKTATYNGKAITVDAAKVTGSKGKVTYSYYSDAACTKALSGAPVNAGTYYAKASVAADDNYNAATSAAVKIVIKKANSSITLTDTTVNYTGKAIAVKTKVAGSKGKVTYTYYSDKACKKKIAAPKNVGTYYVKASVAADTNYNGASTSKAAKLVIKKGKPTITVKTLAKTYKKSVVKKKKQTFSIGASVTGKGKLSYKKTSGSSKLSINKSNGKVTVKKGTKSGTYKIKVKVSAKASKNYNSGSTTKTVTVKVK
ncbi:MAG: penicillin-binding Tp47 domain C-containing protein [Lachnospiraceae bacterium]|nr:penicillin-binding Tp47 domain C-containing protein [Lachnospiraceae bacterium]